MRSRSNGGVIGAYALPNQNFANGVFFIHDAAIYNTGSNPIWPLATGFIYSATGGTISTAVNNANYKTHTFTANGTFTVSIGTGFLEILLVGGGGAGGFTSATNRGSQRGGGGAGGEVTLVTDVFVSGPTTFTVEVGSGGVPTSNTTYTSGDSKGRLTRVTSNTGFSFVSYGGGGGDSILQTGGGATSSDTTYGGAGSSASAAANTVYTPVYTRTNFGTASTGTLTNYSAGSGGNGNSQQNSSGTFLGSGGGGGAGYTPGYNGFYEVSDPLVAYSSFGGDGYQWPRTGLYYGAGGPGGTTYGWPNGVGGRTSASTGLYGSGSRSAISGWSYSSNNLNDSGGGNAPSGYGVGGGGSSQYATGRVYLGGAGGSGTVIFCYRYK